MSVTDEVAIQLTNLVENWRERLSVIPAQVVHQKPAEDRWSLSEVVGHLVDSANNNHQRFIRAQSVAVLEFPGYEQNNWVAASFYREMDWLSLVRLWSEYNQLLAGLIRRIPSDRLATICVISPNEPCTLEYLILDYVRHMEHHLKILDRRIQEFGSGDDVDNTVD